MHNQTYVNLALIIIFVSFVRSYQHTFTYDKNIYPNSKFDESSVKLSKDQCPTGIKEDIKSIEEHTIADTSIKYELTFKSDETEAVSSNVKGYVSGEWNQIRLRASGTNIFNEIKENVSVTTESKEQFSCSKEVKLSNVRFQNNKFKLQIKNIKFLIPHMSLI